MDLSIIIVSYNTKDLLASCIKSVVENTKKIKFEIIVVDNNSKDQSAEVATKLGAIVLKNKKNLGFAAANNQGFKASHGEYILFLNSDTEIHDNVLGEMVDWMKVNSKVGVSSCALKNKDGSLQATGGFFPSLVSVFSWMTIQDLPFVDSIIKPFHPYHSKSFLGKSASFYDKSRELDWVTGAFLLTKREVLEAVGGWDESYFMYVEEVDLCFRIKKLGYKVQYLPKWNITHLGGGSSKTSEFALISEYQGMIRFYKKFYPFWQMPILRATLKIGALGRIVLFGILEGRQSAQIYAKAFRTI